LVKATKDVVTGMFLSNVVMYFIILTTATTLHAHGMKNIETAHQAAEALRPLAGKGAYWLFTLGLVGTGILGVPILAGSCAYAIAEAARWRSASLNMKFHLAPRFYAVIAVSVLVGLALNYAGFNAVKMLFWSAILNGILAPPLVVLVVLLTSDKKVMGRRANAPGAQVLGWICAAAMSAAALALIVP
jgi:Mn2+/Fe2+ NRAMP family transporter